MNPDWRSARIERQWERTPRAPLAVAEHPRQKRVAKGLFEHVHIFQFARESVQIEVQPHPADCVARFGYAVDFEGGVRELVVVSNARERVAFERSNFIGKALDGFKAAFIAGYAAVFENALHAR